MIELTPRKIRAIFTLVLVLIIHLIFDVLYRPMAYSTNLSDLGLKDSFTQVTAVLGISLLIVIVEKEKTTTTRSGNFFLAIVPVIAMITYEFIQILIPSLRFDFQDLFFTLGGGIFAWLIQRIVVR